jgi:hypothetical protein
MAMGAALCGRGFCQITQYIPQNLQYNVANFPMKSASTQRNTGFDCYHKNSTKPRRQGKPSALFDGNLKE